MEKLANEDKKELFMKMAERAKNGTLDMMRMTQSKNYNEEYSRIGNNHGPFGLLVNGINKDGKISVSLIEELGKQIPSSMGGPNYATMEFEEEKLNEFMDIFFDMNNMEILNEFYKTESDSFKGISLQDYKNEEHNDFFDRLVILNGLDYLSQQGDQTLVQGRDNYTIENGLNIAKLDGRDGKSYICLNKGENLIEYDIRKGIITKRNLKSPEFEEYLSTFLQSIDDLPKVYESIMSGTYKKEDFISTRRIEKEQTPLQKRETELLGLEKEERKITEAEALISKQNEKTGEQK